MIPKEEKSFENIDGTVVETINAVSAEENVEVRDPPTAISADK